VSTQERHPFWVHIQGGHGQAASFT
jgi:hypothetical protein